MKKSLISLGVVAVLLAGCAGMSETQQGALSGSANGAAIGAIAGETGWGTVAGAGGRRQ